MQHMTSAYVSARAGTNKWVLAQRLTARLKERGYEVAIHPKTYRKWEAEHYSQLVEDRLASAMALLREIREKGWTASQDRQIAERLREILA